ncbi:glycosyltransferase family 1 protein [Anabaena sp. UHCC 0399]|uniref:glycosyltransferase family 1 protein n=1 Tax=Anabaena sp. UHCC 0399 TaxID=3110238 RepID=UPI002B1F09D5|nr:glycosyltransferase family 1 protein [Anabaena sp. UHCC 0399]MEA5567724.1 glycosyltransferase family 1 protein [Anabaena sp. UHCC 0399]
MYYTSNKVIPQEYEKLAVQRPIRVLHVVGGMNRGGIETWLMHVLRHIDRDRIHMDFLVHTTEPCHYDDEVRQLGSQVIPCPNPTNPWFYAHNFRRILHQHGLYDIIHSHVHHYTGFILYLAQLAGVPARIAHSHLDSSYQETKAKWQRKLYLAFMKQLITHHASVGLACSQDAAVDLFNSGWTTDPRWQLLYCGIDLKPFQEVIDTGTIRTALSIPGDAFVIGHVGRFEPQKNHKFLIEIAAAVAQKEPKMRLLLVGQGFLRTEIEQQVVESNLVDKVIFAGTRSDVPHLMRGVMDLFLFPSLYEGLPIVGLETQAAGLPIIMSDVIPRELDQVESLTQRLSLSQPASVWAEAVLAARNARRHDSQNRSLASLEKSKFNIKYSVESLIKVYENQYYQTKS